MVDWKLTILALKIRISNEFPIYAVYILSILSKCIVCCLYLCNILHYMGLAYSTQQRLGLESNQTRLLQTQRFIQHILNKDSYNIHRTTTTKLLSNCLPYRKVFLRAQQTALVMMFAKTWVLIILAPHFSILQTFRIYFSHFCHHLLFTHTSQRSYFSCSTLVSFT